MSKKSCEDFFDKLRTGSPKGEPVLHILLFFLFFREPAEELFLLLLKLGDLFPAEGVHEAQDHED